MEGYMIKEAAKKLQVEAHVLRYWEDELGLTIKRNSMGHRYYDERDIKLFEQVKALKKSGMSLKDIRDGIDKYQSKNNEKKSENTEMNNSEIILELRETQNPNNVNSEVVLPEQVEESDNVVDFKVAQMQAVMNKVVANALRENKEIITSSIKNEIIEDVMKQFDTVMREKEEKEEARFKKLDENLRMLQRLNDEVAATKAKKRFGWKKY